jgi:WD40 repeat protein
VSGSSLTLTDDEHNSEDPVTFSPNGRFFVAPSHNDGVTTLRIWNTQTGELATGPSRLDDKPECLAFTPDDCHIAISCITSYTTSIRILDIHTGHLNSGPWKGHSDDVMALAFPPDGIWHQVQLNTADLLGHAQSSSGFLGVGTSMQDGWVTDASGDILFLVPKDHRSSLVWPQNIAVIDGSGIRTELYLERFKYGRNWTECFGVGK